MDDQDRIEGAPLAIKNVRCDDYPGVSEWRIFNRHVNRVCDEEKKQKYPGMELHGGSVSPETSG